MKALTAGHKYELGNFENWGDPGQIIQFIEKVPHESGDGTMVTVNDGTTNEEVLDMLIDRMNHLQGKFPCRENALVITKLEEAMHWLAHRTAQRRIRGVEGMHKA